jgi:2-oxoglutarate dehydrogenase E2 component (dihydrolipoamide succinyltransferase)
MEVEIIVPELGAEAPEATFVAWLKEVGEEVLAGEAIAEVMTDKVNVEVESPVEGVLQSRKVQPDQKVTPGAVIGTVRVP